MLENLVFLRGVTVKGRRLDIHVVELSLAPSRQKAQALIMAGDVKVDGVTQRKPSFIVPDGAEILVANTADRYVSRGAHKLLEALRLFPINPEKKVCLDVGASTGGFTDVLLRNGATHVFAVDVGYNQLAWSLRSNPQVTCLERQNIRHLEKERLTQSIDLVVIDVSFISLTLVLPHVERLCPPDTPIVALIKPQFEAGREQVGKNGVIRDEEIRMQTVDKIRDWAVDNSFWVGEVIPSPIKGPAGNVEFLIHLATPK